MIKFAPKNLLLLLSILLCCCCRRQHAIMALKRPYKIAIVPKMRAAEAFYGLTFQGCQDKVATLGTEDDVMCVYEGSWLPDIEENLRILNELIDDPTIDGISVSVLDLESYTPVINRGIAMGKPIITFDSDAEESNRLAYVGTDNFAMGQELAKLLRQIKPDGGSYGIVSGTADNLLDRERGVRDGLEGSGWVEVSKSPKDGKEDSDISLQKMWEIVDENDVQAVVSVVGLPMFKENTTDWRNFVDSNRDVLTIIADTLPIQLDLMQINYVDALVGQLPYTMGYQSAETLITILDEYNNRKVPIHEALPDEIIFGTHQLEVLRIPLQLPSLDFDYNYIGDMAILGYVLCSIIAAASLGFMLWTCINREARVVSISQPMFLYMICTGTLMMGSAMIPLSIDDENDKNADAACMSVPWLVTIGFTISFSALFSKTWRINKIFFNPTPMQRIKVTEKDVMLPFVVLLSLNIIALICWTAIAPLKFVRTLEDGTDPWNRVIGSYGHCESTSGTAGGSIPFLIIIAIINLTALVVANVQAYRSRTVRTEFNESSYIAMANASFLQALLIGIPILFLTREHPQAYFVVISVVLFILCGAILVFIFVPKIVALRQSRKNPSGSRFSRISITGVGNNTTSSRGSLSDNPVQDIMKRFQALSWEDKTALLAKLAPVGPPEGMLVSSAEVIDLVESQAPEPPTVTPSSPEKPITRGEEPMISNATSTSRTDDPTSRTDDQDQLEKKNFRNM